MGFNSGLKGLTKIYGRCVFCLFARVGVIIRDRGQNWAKFCAACMYRRYVEHQRFYRIIYCNLNTCLLLEIYTLLRVTLFNPLKPTGHVMQQQFNIQQLYALPHTVFMCFVFIWEQTATCATYSINWLVFMTEMKSVYSAVRTGPLNKAVCASSLKG